MAARAAVSRPVGRAALLHEVQQVASTFVKYACAAYVVKTYLVSTTACTGPSMLPTFNTRGDRPWLPVPIPFLKVRGDLMVLERVSVLAKTIKVGDVVTAYSVQNPRHIVCKRVLGLEGDTIKVPWSSTSGPSRIVKVPQGHIWLQGDNLLNSTDSRHYGPVPYALLVGKAVAKGGSTENQCRLMLDAALAPGIRKPVTVNGGGVFGGLHTCNVSGCQALEEHTAKWPVILQLNDDVALTGAICQQ